MTRIINKSELTYRNGYIVDTESNVVPLPDEVYSQLMFIELRIQELRYLHEQPKAAPVPSLEGFEQQSEFEKIELSASTPNLDKEYENSLAILGDLRSMENTKAINAVLDEIQDALAWLESDEFVEGDCVKRLDLPVIGDPLSANANTIISHLIGLIDE